MNSLHGDSINAQTHISRLALLHHHHHQQRWNHFDPFADITVTCGLGLVWRHATRICFVFLKSEFKSFIMHLRASLTHELVGGVCQPPASSPLKAESISAEGLNNLKGSSAGPLSSRSSKRFSWLRWGGGGQTLSILGPTICRAAFV